MQWRHLTEAAKLRWCKPVQLSSQLIPRDGQFQEALGYLKTEVHFCKASFCFHWLERECNVGFISLPVSNVASKPEIVVQVLSTPPLTAERSYTTHVLRTGNDQGQAWSKHCNQSGARKRWGEPRDEQDLTSWNSHMGRSWLGADPISWILSCGCSSETEGDNHKTIFRL